MDAQVKNQVIERIRQANNILVTVSTDPSVDQLATCVGLTLLLNKMEKQATAVFSGKIPPLLQFLEPSKTIEPNTDSLRDFIISLDKNKADKLRYKVEDQMVRIFITPYRTSLSENDLEFSQGDFNVEVVIALGVKDKAHIDSAITAHGRILHDATVISVNAGSNKAVDVAQINWQEPAASSLAEMVVSISEAFGSGLIDNQMANAFLTGIVSETECFKNTKTNPKVMTIAAQLMAAGANQQLIVSKLEPPAPPPLVPAIPAVPAGPPITTKPAKDGTLSVSHKPNMADSGEVQVDGKEIRIDDQGNLKTAAELAAAEPKKPKDKGSKEIPAASTPPADDKDTAEPELPLPAAEAKTPPGPHSFLDPKSVKTTLPSTASDDEENQTPLDPLAEPKDKQGGFLDHGPTVTPPSETVDKKTDEKGTVPAGPVSVDSARSAVEEALSQLPFNPAANPIEALNSQPLTEQDAPKAEKGENNEPKDKEPQAEDQAMPLAPPPGPPPITLDPSLFDAGSDKK